MKRSAERLGVGHTKGVRRWVYRSDKTRQIWVKKPKLQSLE